MRSISLRAAHALRAFLGSSRAPRLAVAWTAAASAAVLIAACGPAAPAAPAAPGPGTTAAPGSGSAGSTARAAVASAGPGTPGTPGGTVQATPAGPASASSGPAPDGQPCDPRLIGPVAASFVSAARGYLLGITLSDCAAHAGSKIAVRKTTDGGLHWTAVPAPPAPWGGVAPDGTGRIPADGVTSVLFADEQDGWAYGPGLWATHDGGASWRRVDLAGRVVRMMAAGGGQVLASLESCDPADSTCDGPHAAGLVTSPASRDAWRPVSGAAGEVLTVRAGTGYAVSPGTGPVSTDVSMLTGPADGSARWVSRRLPCEPGAIALAAVTATRLLLACALLGAHPATTSLYASSDAGGHWTRFAVLGLFDGAGAIEQTADGTVLVSGIYDGVELSRDGGRTWTKPAVVDDSLSVQGGGPLAADLVTSDDGYVLGYLGPLWITRDAGRTWTPVPVR